MKHLLLLFALVCFLFVGNHLMAQEVKLNDNFVVESDGTVRYDNSASVFEDLRVSANTVKLRGASVPTYGTFVNSSLQILWFDGTSDQEVFFSVQIPHSYKVNSDLYPHVHWTTSTGTPDNSTNTVKWVLEYAVAEIGSTFSVDTKSSDQIIESISPSGTEQHLITSLGTIPGSNIGISTILICRLYREGEADGFGNDAGLLSFDIHYEIDTSGSRSEFQK